ncbi:MAG TPA: hypothetical protein PLW68_06330 [Casimicrobiaceae bacterium]|nr:hypothetical protein [Casimicrobiaceae bacterium]
MFRLPILILIAMASGTGLGQMMSGPMSTAQYFPLVDGARYDYKFMSGPRASASAVMHVNQTWGGNSQLTGRHMTAVCRTAVQCEEDATDFYRMDADGMRYFGGDGTTPDDVHFMMTYANPEWVLKNPVSPGTMMGSGMGYQNTEMWRAAVSGTNTLMGAQNYMSSYLAQALETVTTPAGTFFNALHIREQRGNGYVRDVWYAAGVGMVRWMDAQEEALLVKVSMPMSPVPAVARAIEYYHSGLDHYFLTADPVEIAALDSGQFAGWQRTNMSFNVVAPSADAAGSASPVCRYYGSPAYGLDTHFYSGSPEECAAVHRNWPDEWQLESSDVFMVYMPDAANGTCPSDTLPIYRTWNARRDTNHRYTMDSRVQTTMMGKGGIAEGYGSPPVAMCSPQ